MLPWSFSWSLSLLPPMRCFTCIAPSDVAAKKSVTIFTEIVFSLASTASITRIVVSDSSILTGTVTRCVAIVQRVINTMKLFMLMSVVLDILGDDYTSCFKRDLFLPCLKEQMYLFIQYICKENNCSIVGQCLGDLTRRENILHPAGACSSRVDVSPTLSVDSVFTACT